ncbi:MAG: glycosyltransferase family protein [Candidatus Methylomirabilis sp.]
MLHAFPLPPNADSVKLPDLLMEGVGLYTATHLRLPFEELSRLRQKIVLETALGYRPDLVIVDRRPVGVRGELLPTLQALKSLEKRATLVLSLRDIVGTDLVRGEWQADHAIPVLEELYDEVWIFGCQVLYDPIKEYQLPDAVARKVRFCGYLGVEPSTILSEETRRALQITGETFVLVTVGNGRGGFQVLDAYVGALEIFPKRPRTFSLLVAGPDLPQEELRKLRERISRLSTTRPEHRVMLMDFSPRLEEYIAAADLVVSMAGYNTLTEIMALEKRAIVIPRLQIIAEQLLRASLFERLGLIRMLHPDQLSPGLMAETLLSALDAPPPSLQQMTELRLDFSGQTQVREHVDRLLGLGQASPPWAP